MNKFKQALNQFKIALIKVSDGNVRHKHECECKISETKKIISKVNIISNILEYYDIKIGNMN